MSTAARELEELRRIREAARLQAEEDKRIEDEKQAKLDKKNAFLNRAAAFQQKKGPSDEEIRVTVKKESSKRNFGRKLDRLLKESPDQNAQALELGLRGRAGNNTSYGDEDYYQGEDTTEGGSVGSNSFRPPPPPPKKLIGLGSTASSSTSSVPPPPPPPPPKSSAAEDAASSEEPIQQQKQASPWTYVVENEAIPYYWNTVTNETTLEPPVDYDGAIYSAATFYQVPATSSTSESANAAEASSLAGSWYELQTDNGELIYQRISDGYVQYEKPQGVTYISIWSEDQTSVVHWQVMFDSKQQKVYYKNTSTEELLDETAKPMGIVTVVESSEHGEFEH